MKEEQAVILSQGQSLDQPQSAKEDAPTISEC